MASPGAESLSRVRGGVKTLRSYLITAAVAAHQPGAVFKAKAHPEEPTLLSLLTPSA